MQTAEAIREQKGDLMTATVYHKPPGYGTVQKRRPLQLLQKFIRFGAVTRR